MQSPNAAAAAVNARMIAANPFVSVPRTAGANAEREVYVDVEVVLRVMDAASSPELRLLVALARFAGVRVPSGVRNLRWGDVDWSRRTLRIESPKTARHGKPFRETPIVAELLPLLAQAFHDAPEGSELVLPTLRLHTSPTPLRRALRSAGVIPWPRAFHTLRASCVTDFSHRSPLADVAAWMGHTRTVAAKHYLRPTEASLAAATGPLGGVTGGAKLVNPIVSGMVTQPAARPCTASHDRSIPSAIHGTIATARDQKRTRAAPREAAPASSSGPDRATASGDFLDGSPLSADPVLAPVAAIPKAETRDPDLARVATAWPTLSPSVRAGILALIGAAEGTR